MVSRACSIFVRTTVAGVLVFQAAVVGGQTAPAGQQPPPAGRGAGQRPAQPGAGRRASPPQPQQKQGTEYFTGSWTFTWTGRESPITPGPRSGTARFARAAAPNRLDVQVEGKVEEGPAYQESGTIDWDDAKKTVTIKERLWNGTELQGVGDWSSALSIKYESGPVKAGSQAIRLRRTYAILSATSFTVAEEISIDNGPFQRLGNGSFLKSPQ